jgi:hypothetical protein
VAIIFELDPQFPSIETVTALVADDTDEDEVLDEVGEEDVDEESELDPQVPNPLWHLFKIMESVLLNI